MLLHDLFNIIIIIPWIDNHNFPVIRYQERNQTIGIRILDDQKPVCRICRRLDVKDRIISAKKKCIFVFSFKLGSIIKSCRLLLFIYIIYYSLCCILKIVGCIDIYRFFISRFISARRSQCSVKCIGHRIRLHVRGFGCIKLHAF